MPKRCRSFPWLRFLGALNVLALVAVLSQPVAADGVDACGLDAEGCSCIFDSGSALVPDGCHTDANPGFRCHAGSQCQNPE